jgi:hypothetical protein
MLPDTDGSTRDLRPVRTRRSTLWSRAATLGPPRPGGDLLKFTATIVLAFQAHSLKEAGAKLDEALHAARERDDMEVASIDVRTPPDSAPVSLPQLAVPPAPSQRVPHPIP